MNRIPGLSRAVGAAAGSTLALALLVCGCVFAAMAGPAISLHTRSQALQQTLAGLPDTTKTVQVSANWSNFVSPAGATVFGSGQSLTESQLAASAHEIGRGLSAIPLPLGAGAWAGLSTGVFGLNSGVPASVLAGTPRLEVVYRDTLTSNAELVAGSYASAAVPAGTVAVAATTQTAARFELHPGSLLVIGNASGTVSLFVTAILRERSPGSTFWQQDSSVEAPLPAGPGNVSWVGGVFADPGQLAAMQNAFSGPGMELMWEFPLAVGGVNADQAQGLYDDLNHAAASTPTLTGSLASGVNATTVASPLTSNLSLFLGNQAAIETVLLLLFASMIVVGAAVILLAARMIVARRDGELTMLRARGGSLRQVAAVMLRAAVVVAGPAALAGAGLAIAVMPGGTASSGLGWSLAAIAVAAALAGPPLTAAWQHRRPAPPANPARMTTAGGYRSLSAWRRPVAEVTACAAAVAGLVVLHDQGLPAGGQIDVFLTAAPVLVAIPVVLVMLRLYPLAVRGLLRFSARGAGATGFVALSRAAKSSLTGVLPAFALVLALTLATFAGMVSGGIASGEVAASWQATGADVLITTYPSSQVSPASVQAIAVVRGVRHATAIWNTKWISPGGQPVTVTAVDPASYAAVVAGTPFPAFPAARISPPGGTLPSGAPVPVLASPSAAAILGSAPAELSSAQAMGPVTVRVAGVLSSTPAQPGGGTFIVMPMQTLPGPNGLPAPNMALVTGSAINQAQLSAVIGKMIPDSVTTFRSTVLAALASSPLQHGAVLIVVLTIAVAAAFGLFIVILGLALGSAERELTLARLNVMGHERATRLVLAEAMPAVIAAAFAGAVCAVVLPSAIGSSIDLSVFTGTGAHVQFRPDVTALGLPAAAIIVLALITLVAQTRTRRRRGVTSMLRVT